MNKQDESFYAGMLAVGLVIVGPLFLVIILAPAALWGAYVATVMWKWFVVPLGLPAIGTMRMTGIALMIGLFRSAQYVKDERAAKEKCLYYLGVHVLGPLMVLGFGWTVQYLGGL